MSLMERATGMSFSDRNWMLVATQPPDAGYAWWLMENFWQLINEAASQRGGQCVLVYPEAGPVPPGIRDSSITVAVHDFGDRSPKNMTALRKLIRSQEILNVYLTDARYYDWLYGVLRVWGVRRIIVHDHTPGERSDVPKWKWWLKRAVHRLKMFSADRYIAVSDFVARRMEEVGGVVPERISVVHNGIPPNRYEGSRRPIRQTFGIIPSEILVVNVGRAHRYKGIEFMIDVASELLQRGCEDVHFLHVGDGPHLSAFKRYADSQGVSDRFHFAGERDDVYNVLSASDIAFHASKGEAFSLAILEYMLAGLAVLAPDHCGNPEAIEEGEDGLLYTPGDREHAVEKLTAVVVNTDLRRRLGAAAERKIAKRFTLAGCNREFMRVIQNWGA